MNNEQVDVAVTAIAAVLFAFGAGAAEDPRVLFTLAFAAGWLGKRACALLKLA